MSSSLPAAVSKVASICTVCQVKSSSYIPPAFLPKSSLYDAYSLAFLYCTLYCDINRYRGPGSSVGIATELRAGRSGIESRWGRDFPPVQTGPGVHPTSCKMDIGSFPGVKCGRGVLLTTHHLPVPRSWNSRAIPLPTLWATPGL